MTSDVAAVLRDRVTVEGLLARACDPKRERWLEQVRRTGACRHPIRLSGAVRRGDELVYTTAREPDGALMVRCGNRREECCPSCAHEYRGDMWQLIYAGLAGGRKGVPEAVAGHPQVFATLTAPSFGQVHTRRDDAKRCRCGQRHEVDDAELGAAIDAAAYDYEGAVLWNWHAPGLWNRFVTELVRVLAGKAGVSESAYRGLVRVAYAKVAEFQARGLVHFHAIVRLDSATDRALGPPPGVQITAAALCDAVAEAAARSRLHGHAGGGEVVELRFGEQLHTRVLAAGGQDGPELCPQAVAAYVAKYSCKGSHEAITRAGPGGELELLRDSGVPEQLVQMAAAALRLADRPGLQKVGGWVHMLGFRGHFVTKSRGYSTTLGALRATRAAYRAERDPQPADQQLVDGDALTVVVSAWEYVGLGLPELRRRAPGRRRRGHAARRTRSAARPTPRTTGPGHAVMSVVRARQLRLLDRPCAWCAAPVVASRVDARYCSTRCRQAAHRAGIRRVELAATAAPLRLAYADPPYPGKSRLYRGQPDYAGEVDHDELLGRLQTYDGWALSTSAEALPRSSATAVARDVDLRVAAWMRSARPHATA